MANKARAGSRRRADAGKGNTPQLNSVSKTGAKGKPTSQNDLEVQQDKKVLDELDQRVNIAGENGLFTKGQNRRLFDDLQTHLDKAYAYLEGSPPNLIGARREHAQAYNAFNTAVQKGGIRYRMQYAYALPHFVYLLVVLSILLILSWVRAQPQSPLVNLNFVPVPKRAFMWGAIGSILQGLYALWRQVSDRKFRGGFFIWYISLPVIGAILGGLMYMIVQFGVMSATQTTIQNPSVALLLAAIAGFSWEWSVSILKNVEQLFKRDSGQTSKSQ